MILELKHIGFIGSASKIIELTVISNQTSVMDDVTNLNGFVDESLITNLREVANQLEEQNLKLQGIL